MYSINVTINTTSDYVKCHWSHPHSNLCHGNSATVARHCFPLAGDAIHPAQGKGMVFARETEALAIKGSSSRQKPSRLPP